MYQMILANGHEMKVGFAPNPPNIKTTLLTHILYMHGLQGYLLILCNQDIFIKESRKYLNSKWDLFYFHKYFQGNLWCLSIRSS
jgi:hypothetical protein